MNYITYKLTFFLLLFSFTIYGQDNIILKNRNKLNKRKEIKLDRDFTIKTINDSYVSRIVNLTDSTLSVFHRVKSGKDTSYIYPVYGKNRDTIVYKPLYKTDTLVIPFTEIQYLEKDWFKNRSWLEPFGYAAIGAAIGVIFLPIAAADDGSKGVKDWAIFEGILVGISAPPIFLGTRKSKYNLQTEWKIIKEKDDKALK